MSLEPEAQRLTVNIAGDESFAAAPITIAAMSIAISLKRIADALTYQPTGGENLHDMINAIRHNTMPTAR